MSELDVMWRASDGALLRCLELAHESFVAGGLPVGSVIIDSNGTMVSQGRNRAYDPAGGTDRLQRTPIAHAELNALTGVGRVVFIAPDPSDDGDAGDPDGFEPEWIVIANLLFLSGVAAYSGLSAPMIIRARRREPEITVLMDSAATSRPHQKTAAARE